MIQQALLYSLDNPYARCGSNDKRDAVESEHEPLFETVKRDDYPSLWPSKRCCILCENPHARCGLSVKRDAVSSLTEAVEGHI
ncbi:uncharacterized protein N7469_009585 [Penicillium citrinum]|uniref:Uncharacterized protein n=1 Tax=Penicillium citrinum TaxID=5077 RepID=A0A9W9TFE8_PENCI|nr:uncharacterized protein N7469_009585 [Penicillium citrinum]KAJ5220698.1 hypothetical protein N7469_009585 [Penicillium citrinum]KAK5798638.1 hypothetical protein VI817_004928 [Penicillium citrinum]